MAAAFCLDEDIHETRSLCKASEASTAIYIYILWEGGGGLDNVGVDLKRRNIWCVLDKPSAEWGYIFHFLRVS